MSANDTIHARVQHPFLTAEALTAANPVLLAGEVVYESDTRKHKIGDGTTPWNELPYAGSVLPDAIPAAMIDQDPDHRFVSDDEKSAWNTKQNTTCNELVTQNKNLVEAINEVYTMVNKGGAGNTGGSLLLSGLFCKGEFGYEFLSDYTIDHPCENIAGDKTIYVHGFRNSAAIALGEQSDGYHDGAGLPINVLIIGPGIDDSSHLYICDFDYYTELILLNSAGNWNLDIDLINSNIQEVEPNKPLKLLVGPATQTRVTNGVKYKINSLYLL